MKLGFGADIARPNTDMIISALWTFIHAQGLLTDDIGEASVDAGITGDGVTLKDGRLDLTHMAVITNDAIRVKREIDALWRYAVRGDGETYWGDGAGAQFNRLSRQGTALRYDNDIEIMGYFGLGGNILLSVATTATLTGSYNNFATGTTTVMRVPTSGTVNFTGLANGLGGRLFVITPIGSHIVNLIDESGLSSASNRIITPGATDYAVAAGDSAVLWYDITTARWRVIASTI